MTPFHEGVPNQMLSRWFDGLQLQAGAQIFVPLCGKAFDMHWLMERQCRVLGVEISEIAAGDFFTEQGLAVTRSQGERFDIFQSPNIRILCGDVFDLQTPDLATVNAVYDRASLVALPGEIRKRYAGHLLSHLPVGVSMLLVSFEYDSTHMNGPPFSVSEAEVQALYGSDYNIRLVESRQAIERYPRFLERGLQSIVEHAFLCTSGN